MKEVHVVAGIIFSSDQQQILIAKRPDHLHQGGLWEFPGGKVNPGEFSLGALKRELKEELAILITAAEPFMDIRHQYADKAVFLQFWQITAFDGEACGNEGQKIAWVDVADLVNYAFPAANQTVVKKLIFSD